MTAVEGGVSSPYDEITTVLPKNDLGWFSKEHEKFIGKMIQEKKPKIIVELGCSLGKSTIFMTKLLPDDGLLFAVDTWKGTPEFHFAYSSLIPTLYQQFLSNVIHENLQGKIVPLRMEFVEAAKKIGCKPDLVFFSSFYDEFSVYSNLCVWFPLIQGHGTICGDKWSWGPKTGRIAIAVKKFCKERKLKYKTNEWFWVIYE
jgi:hypothetical protein